MRPEEIIALGEVTGDAVRGVALQAREVHAGISRRVFGAVGPLSLPVRVAHDAIARGSYRAAGELGRVLVRGGAGAVALAASGSDGRSLEDSGPGRAVVGVLNGAFGDALARRDNRLALPMTVRAGGFAVALSPEALRRAYPSATPKLVVFVHGLGQTEDAWTRRAERSVPYGSRLSLELGCTPVYVRYNSGRRISENGRDLAVLLEELVSAWPVEVQEIALVGHSVGGLVARSACEYGAGSEWGRQVRQVISLGTPHRGMPLERLAAAAGAVLARAPETRPVAKALEMRSAGIKDLRYGGLNDGSSGSSGEIPFLPSVGYYFVSPAGLAPVGRQSAWAHPGGGAPMRFPVDHYREVRGVGYFDLLNHPGVYEVIHDWLDRSQKGLPAPRPALPRGS